MCSRPRQAATQRRLINGEDFKFASFCSFLPSNFERASFLQAGWQLHSMMSDDSWHRRPLESFSLHEGLLGGTLSLSASRMHCAPLLSCMCTFYANGCKPAPNSRPFFGARPIVFNNVKLYFISTANILTCVFLSQCERRFTHTRCTAVIDTQWP